MKQSSQSLVKSTGPKTPQGKANSASNSLKHGLSVALCAADLTPSQMIVVELLQEQGICADQALALTIKIVEYERNARYMRSCLDERRSWNTHALRIGQVIADMSPSMSQVNQQIRQCTGLLVAGVWLGSGRRYRLGMLRQMIKELNADKKRREKHVRDAIKYDFESLMGAQRYYKRASLQMLKALARAYDL